MGRGDEGNPITAQLVLVLVCLLTPIALVALGALMLLGAWADSDGADGVEP